MRTSEGKAFVRTLPHTSCAPRSPSPTATPSSPAECRPTRTRSLISDLVIEELDRLGTLVAPAHARRRRVGRRSLPSARRYDESTSWSWRLGSFGGCRRRLADGGSSRAAAARGRRPTTSGSRPRSMRLIENAVKSHRRGPTVSRCRQPMAAGVDHALGRRRYWRWHLAGISRRGCSTLLPGPISDVTSYTGGTGLGLAIVKAIAEAHGGTVEVTSERGVGSTFVMCLPRRGPVGGHALLSTETEFGPDGDAVHRQLM